MPTIQKISAPVGCLQYFAGVTGQFSSFNYNDAGGLMLSNTDYTICIRTERNFCGVQYSPCLDTGVTYDGFLIELHFK